MTVFAVNVKEVSVVKLILEYLESHGLNITQISLERETGIINGHYSDDCLFLRQLIVDGQWDTAIDFVEPLSHLPEFDTKQFTYLITKYKYYELLCIKQEPGPMHNNEFTVEEIVECLKSLEDLCPTPEDYRSLCLLLTLPGKLSDHASFRKWNPSSARIECFHAVLPLVERFLSPEPPSDHGGAVPYATPDRLVSLVVKGLFYESCVEFCQNKAIRSLNATDSVQLFPLLNNLHPKLIDADLSLLSWLESVPDQSFSLPFEQKTLSVSIEELRRPGLNAAWTQHILTAPIKPAGAFPHAYVPPTRNRTAERLMSKSLIPGYEFGLADRNGFVMGNQSPSAVGGPTGGLMLKSAIAHAKSGDTMSRSVMPGFTLGQPPLAPLSLLGHGAKPDSDSLMEKSIDHLFDTPDARSSTGGPASFPLNGNNNMGGMLEQPGMNMGQFVDGNQMDEPIADCISPPDDSLGSNMAQSVYDQLEDIKKRMLGDQQQQQPNNTNIQQAQQTQFQQQNNINNNNTMGVKQTGGQLFQTFHDKRDNNAVIGNPTVISEHNNNDVTLQLMQMSVHDRMANTQDGIVNSGQLQQPQQPFVQSSQRQQQPMAMQPVNQQQTHPTGPLARPQSQQIPPMQQQMVTQPTRRPATAVVTGVAVPRPQPSNCGPLPGPSVASSRPGGAWQPNVAVPSTIKEDEVMTISSVSSTTSNQAAQNNGINSNYVHFLAVNRLEDSQAIRATTFHPSGKYYAVGTNSRQMHICRYPEVATRISPDWRTRNPEILLTRPKQHRGSVYCVAFNSSGDLLVTGSNDKTARLMQFNADVCKLGSEHNLEMHDGTVRDVVFMEDTTNRSSLLISGGAGNCKIYITDCQTGSTVRAIPGHTAPILGLYTWGGCMFASCSQDRTVRFWDLRCSNAVNIISPSPRTTSAPVTSVCVDPSCKLLVSGHEDSTVMLYDISGSRVVQIYKPHVDEVRTIRFSPGAYYLLSGSYDKRLVITDVRGDLMGPLTYLPVAEHDDKIIQCRWHPSDFTFISTSADRSAVLWALPPAQRQQLQ